MRSRIISFATLAANLSRIFKAEIFEATKLNDLTLAATREAIRQRPSAVNSPSFTMSNKPSRLSRMRSIFWSGMLPSPCSVENICM